MEYAQVSGELAKLPDNCPALPSPDLIRQRAGAEFDRLEHVLASATVEEKRELIACYVQKIKTDPDQQSVQIGLYPTLLSQKIAWFKPSSELSNPASWCSPRGFVSDSCRKPLAGYEF